MKSQDYADNAHASAWASLGSRPLTVAGGLGAPDDLLGWTPIDSSLADLVHGSLGSPVNAFCPAVVEKGWRDGAYAKYADIAVLDVVLSDKAALLDRLRSMQVLAVVVDAPSPALRIFLPFKETFYFFNCCSAGKFESLAAWHDMLCDFAAKLHVPLMPGDTSPVKRFEVNESPSQCCPQIIPGAPIDPSDWLEAQDGPLINEVLH